MDLSFDFFQYYKKYARISGESLKKDPFIKAFPKVKEDNIFPPPTVLDGTCGTGQDSVRILMQGYNVIACERHQNVYDALSKALDEVCLNKKDEKIKKIFDLRFSLRFGDVKKVIPSLETPPDIIYFDPMYGEQKGRTALPRKEMQIFHEVVGNDQDAEITLSEMILSSQAKDKIIVKRPLKEIPLFRKPDYSFKGKSTRYDVYKIFSQNLK